MERPAHIPPKIWTMAKRSGQRNASHESIVRTAEMLVRRLSDRDMADEDKIVMQPWLTRRQTRIIRDALMGHDTVFDDDVSELFRLRSWFDGNAPESGAMQTGERY